MVEATMKRIGLPEMIDTADNVYKAGKKTTFFIDRTENASTFYRYKGTLVELAPLVIGEKLGKTPKAECIEKLRLGLKAAVEIGHHFAVFLDKTKPDILKDYTDPLLPWETIVNPEKFAKTENYKKILKPGEDVDMHFKNKGGYFMKEGYATVFISTLEDAEIPNLQKLYPPTQFEYIIIS